LRDRPMLSAADLNGKDLWSIAGSLIEQYGMAACDVAERRAAEAMDKRDLEVASIWTSVFERCAELLRSERETRELVN